MNPLSHTLFAAHILYTSENAAVTIYVFSIKAAKFAVAAGNFWAFAFLRSIKVLFN